MKWVVGGILAASLLFGGTTMAGAVDFRFQGEILFGTGFLSSAFITERNGQRTEAASADKFATLQRFRLQNGGPSPPRRCPLFYVWKWGTTFGATTNLLAEVGPPSGLTGNS